MTECVRKTKGKVQVRRPVPAKGGEKIRKADPEKSFQGLPEDREGVDLREAALVRRIRFHMRRNGRTSADVAGLLKVPKKQVKALQKKYHICRQLSARSPAAALFRSKPIGQCPVCFRLMYLPCLWCQGEEARKKKREEPPPSDLGLDEAFEGKLGMSTAEMGLPAREANMLENRGILTLRDILCAGPERLAETPNFGVKMLSVVYAAVERVRNSPPPSPESEYGSLKLDLGPDEMARLEELHYQQRGEMTGVAGGRED